nr:DNA polymerase [Kineosphaera limosa]
MLAAVLGPGAPVGWGESPVPRVALLGAGVRRVVDLADFPAVASGLEADRPRWTWWSAQEAARPLVHAGVRVSRAWDVAEAHRLLLGGWHAGPGRAWAHAHGLNVDDVPKAPTGDLFEAADATSSDGDALVRADGHLRPDAVAGTWPTDDERLLAWADAALTCARAQRARAEHTWPRLVATIHAESAAAALCEELRHDGLPVDRPALVAIVGPLSGPRGPRDEAVLRHVPGREHTDLRNPQQVRELLQAVGIDVPSTRKHVLEAFRDVHPVVAALLAWRKEERIATTYGLRWMDEHIGADDRLRGTWTACDGAGGRMTAESGLHNLPAVLRPGVAAHEGHVLVRADLGQIEPRVLAVVSGDAAVAQASRDDDLYAPVAQRLRVERPIAKVAVLAAMYGQRSGAAGQALRGLERAYPIAMAHLDRAYSAGVRGEPLRTYGGRLIPTGSFVTGAPIGADPRLDAARGRFARNAIIQGAAAELFKAWAATVRATIREFDAQIVLCLHDELLVHTPREHADEVAQAVHTALIDAARRWSAGAPVRFVADISVVHRWSDAKG